MCVYINLSVYIYIYTYIHTKDDEAMIGIRGGREYFPEDGSEGGVRVLKVMHVKGVVENNDISDISRNVRITPDESPDESKDDGRYGSGYIKKEAQRGQREVMKMNPYFSSDVGMYSLSLSLSLTHTHIYIHDKFFFSFSPSFFFSFSLSLLLFFSSSLSLSLSLSHTRTHSLSLPLSLSLSNVIYSKGAAPRYQRYGRYK